jgi:aryl-alcohol dehydrogenase-like predicted oxidoreductase
MDRRNALGAIAGMGAMAFAGETAAQPAPDQKVPIPCKGNNCPDQTRSGDMLYRTLGKTGEKVSVIGLGGFHLGSAAGETEAAQIVRKAVDSGVTFMDNSWDYHEGKSETWMGTALAGGYRQKVFLMSKFDGRTKQKALQQLDDTLRRLKTDHLDLWQFHENIRLEDPDRFFSDGGAVEAVTEARKAGKTRFIGFTGHKDPVVHLRMLELAAKHGFHFDTVQMPVNIMDYQFRSFTGQVLPKALELGMGVLGMKPIGSGILLKSKTISAPECLNFALTQPVSAVITGIDRMEVLNQALEVVKNFKPLTEKQIAELVSRTKQAAANGAYELFKTSNQFDSTAKNPDWLG